MFKLNHIAIAILLCLVASCNNSSTKKQEQVEEDETPTSGVVTVIFQEVENIRIRSGSPVASLSMYNGYFTDLKMGFIYKTGTKTFEFDLYIPESLISYCHADGYIYTYFVHPGDTINIVIENDVPIATSTNKELKEYDLNLSGRYNLLKLHDTKFSMFSLPIPFAVPENERFTIDEYYLICNDKENFLDSLAHEGLISPHLLDLKKQEIEMERILAPTYSLSYNYTHEHFSDKRLLFFSYRSFMNKYTNIKYGKKNKYHPIKMFDELILDEDIPQATKLDQLFQILTKVGAEAVTEEFEPKKEEFIKFTNDTIWQRLINDIPHLRTVDSKEMVLYDQKMNQVSFNSLMDECKGKVVYIDLWASWCGGCIASFPAGEVLRKEYQDKPVTFLYFAYNDLEKPWLEGVKKYNLDGENTKSYLIASPKAEWLKEMQVKTIPRYIIYDKNGKLVNKTAPGPKSDNIRGVLDNLLK